MDHLMDDEAGEEEAGMGFDTELLLSPFDADIVCSICQKVVENPQELECGHLFCSAHISRWLNMKSTCPICRQPAKRKEVVHFLYSNKLDLVRLRCWYEGCSAALRVDNFRSHTASCPHALVPCRWPGCPCGCVARGDAHLHEDVCEYREMQCPSLCGVTLPAWRLQQHEPLCTHRPCPCPNECGAVLPLASLDVHRAQECPKEMVLCAIPGCGARFPRTDAETHQELEWRAHQSLLQEQISSMRSERLGLLWREDEGNVLRRALEWQNANLEVLSTFLGVEIIVLGRHVFYLLNNGRVFFTTLGENYSTKMNANAAESALSIVRGAGEQSMDTMGANGVNSGRVVPPLTSTFSTPSSIVIPAISALAISETSALAACPEPISVNAMHAGSHCPTSISSGRTQKDHTTHVSGLLQARLQGVKAIDASEEFIVAGFSSGLVRVYERSPVPTLDPQILLYAQVHDEAVQRLLLGVSSTLWVITATSVKKFIICKDESDVQLVSCMKLESPILDACTLGDIFVYCDFVDTLFAIDGQQNASQPGMINSVST